VVVAHVVQSGAVMTIVEYMGGLLIARKLGDLILFLDILVVFKF
jgi:hypothetical protein